MPDWLSALGATGPSRFAQGQSSAVIPQRTTATVRAAPRDAALRLVFGPVGKQLVKFEGLSGFRRKKARPLHGRHAIAQHSRSKRLRKTGLTKYRICCVAASNADRDREIPLGYRAVPNFMAAFALTDQ